LLAVLSDWCYDRYVSDDVNFQTFQINGDAVTHRDPFHDECLFGTPHHIDPGDIPTLAVYKDGYEPSDFIASNQLARHDNRRLWKLDVPPTIVYRDITTDHQRTLASSVTPAHTDGVDQWITDLVSLLCQGLLDIVAQAIGKALGALATYATAGSAAVGTFLTTTTKLNAIGETVQYCLGHWLTALNTLASKIALAHIGLAGQTLTQIINVSPTLMTPITTIYVASIKGMCNVLTSQFGSEKDLLCPDYTFIGLLRGLRDAGTRSLCAFLKDNKCPCSSVSVGGAIAASFELLFVSIINVLLTVVSYIGPIIIETIAT
jgi:hypothetical protein